MLCSIFSLEEAALNAQRDQRMPDESESSENDDDYDSEIEEEVTVQRGKAK